MRVEGVRAPAVDSARHLVALRDRFGDAFVAGIVLHTGPRAYGLGDRIAAASISTLWG